MQKKIILVVIVLIFLLGFCWMRDSFIGSLVADIAGKITGAPTRIGGFSLSVIRQSVKISDFKIYNPRGFPKGVLVDIPRMKVACNLGALFTGKIHLKQLELEIKEIGMVRNKNGQLNVDSLKITEDKPAGKEKKKLAKQLAVQMDLVSLSMGRVVSTDYGAEGPPVIKVYEINLKKTYKNIASAQQLAALIISEPLKAAGIQGLKVYGATILTGVAALPVMAAFTFTAKDHAQETFNVSLKRAYDAGLEVLKTAGKVRKENRPGGVISAEVDGAGVTFEARKLPGGSTQVTISAREFGLPQDETAAGVMYRLREKLK